MASAAENASTDVHLDQAGSSPAAAGLDRAFWSRTLIQALADGSRGRAGDAPAVEDQERTPLSRKRLLLGAAVLGRRLAAMTEPGERVGVLLPNVNAVAVTVFALSAYGRVPAMLNFSAGPRALDGACEAAGIRLVVTSRAFVKALKLEEAVEALSRRVRVEMLEDVRKRLSVADKGIGALYARFPRLLGALHPGRPDDIGVVLFTSGTEGAPKGVALSHANLLANVAQILAIYDFGPDDVVFNALPVFHSFGLTAGLLLPLFGGFRSFLYPSPLQYKQIPGFVKSSGTTILLTTDTFAAGWAKAAEPEDFASVKLTILGAERVKETTRATFGQQFGIRLNEGYGVTETAPVLAVNRPGAERDGTVGQLLPGIEARLEPVPGLRDAGRLFVRGPNVMLGYLKADRPGELQPLEGGWHDTGDIVSIDADGFLTVRGRAKRFAKIGGEMVSLAAVEAQVAALWPQASHAVVNVPDARKGEALVLVTDCQEARLETLLAHGRAEGIPEIMLPRRIIRTLALPVLGTGKLDLAAVDALARKDPAT